MNFTKRTTAWNWYEMPARDRAPYVAHLRVGGAYIPVSLSLPGDCLIAEGLTGEGRYVVAANTPLYLVAR